MQAAISVFAGGDSGGAHGGYVFDRLFLPTLPSYGRLIAERIKRLKLGEEEL